MAFDEGHGGRRARVADRAENAGALGICKVGAREAGGQGPHGGGRAEFGQSTVRQCANVVKR